MNNILSNRRSSGILAGVKGHSGGECHKTRIAVHVPGIILNGMILHVVSFSLANREGYTEQQNQYAKSGCSGVRRKLVLPGLYVRLSYCRLIPGSINMQQNT